MGGDFVIEIPRRKLATPGVEGPICHLHAAIVTAHKDTAMVAAPYIVGGVIVKGVILRTPLLQPLTALTPSFTAPS